MQIFANKEFLSSIANEKILLVGVGGIGCEVLKQLTVGPFKNIEIVLFIDLRSISIQLKSQT